MKTKEIRELNDEDLKVRVSELQEQVFRGRFKKSLGEVDSVKGTRENKKELARVKTIQRERELGIQR